MWPVKIQQIKIFPMLTDSASAESASSLRHLACIAFQVANCTILVPNFDDVVRIGPRSSHSRLTPLTPHRALSMLMRPSRTPPSRRDLGNEFIIKPLLSPLIEF